VEEEVLYLAAAAEVQAAQEAGLLLPVQEEEEGQPALQ
jgi:hypothetical protein